MLAGASTPMADLVQGTRVVLRGVNTASFNRHVAVVEYPTSMLEPRVGVRISGTDKVIKVRPECLELAQAPRSDDDLRGGLSAAYVACVLAEASPETFIPEVSGYPRASHVKRAARPCPFEAQAGLSLTCTSCGQVLNTVFRNLRLKNVAMQEVSVASVSSEAVPHPMSSYTYKASCTLEPGTDSCWISRGAHQRPEWIVYRLGPRERRVDYVSMSIPVPPLRSCLLCRPSLTSLHCVVGK